jgi:hypothetical protein
MKETNVLYLMGKKMKRKMRGINRTLTLKIYGLEFCVLVYTTWGILLNKNSTFPPLKVALYCRVKRDAILRRYGSVYN